MEKLLTAFEPYRHVDPAGWVAIFRQVPPPLGGAAVVLGVIMLLFGSGHLFRVVAAPLGAFIGATWSAPLLARFGVKLPEAQVTSVAALALGGAGLVFPPVVIFLAFGVPAGLLGGQLVGPTDWLLGFAPGFLVGGAAGVIFHREVASVLAAAFGAWMLVEGLLAALQGVAPGLVGFCASNPVPTLALVGCVAVAGAAYQLFIRPSPEDRARQKLDRAEAKQRAAEQQALEKRWSKYTKNNKSL